MPPDAATSGPKIRPLLPSDRQAMAAVFAQAFAAPPWNETWPPDAVVAMVDESLHAPGFLGFAAIMEREVGGFIFGRVETWCASRIFQLKELCVAPRLQRRGIGRALLRHLEDHLASVGVGTVYLATLRDSGPDAFYAAQGYQPNPRLRLMDKQLPAPTPPPGRFPA